LDAFVYEPVFVGSFEDAFRASVFNSDLAAVVVHEGFAFHSRHEAPILGTLVEAAEKCEGAGALALHLARTLNRVRPELDLYLLSNGEVEELGGSPHATALRRVLHLAILEGVQDRYDTPCASRRVGKAGAPASKRAA
jgi:arginine decarboxylase